MCVQDALRTRGTAGLAEVLTQCLSQLEGLVTLIRTPVSDMLRATLGSLAVLDVHARDVTSKLYAPPCPPSQSSGASDVPECVPPQG